MRGITKRYPGVVANDRIDLDVRPGEIHALLGENGAGKSTLMNILYGLAAPDEGEILLDGTPVQITGPSDAIARGISMVHQHFMLVPGADRRREHPPRRGDDGQPGLPRPARGATPDPSSSASGSASRSTPTPRSRPSRSAGSSASRSSRRSTATRGSSSWTSRRPSSRPRRRRRSSPSCGGSRTRATASSSSATSSTRSSRSPTGSRSSGAAGSSASGCPRETDEDDLAELMVGREVQLVGRPRRVTPGRARPCGRRISTSRTIAVARPSTASSFEVRAGEILGIAGVAGNGQDELVEAITGLRKPASRARSRSTARISPTHRRASSSDAGMAFVPGDRHRFGLVLSLPARRQPRPDPVLPSRPSPAGFVRNDGAIDAWAKRAIERVRHPDAVRRPSTPARCPAATSRRSSSPASSAAT